MNHPLIDVEAFRDFEATGWERKAEPYDAFFGPITGRIAGPLLDAARVGPGTRVLDIATGPGYVAGQAAARDAEVIGIDIAAAMVTLACHRHPGIVFHVADADDLPFAEGAFDTVVGNFVLPHLGRPAQSVLECSRVLTATGMLALSMWDVPEHNRLFGLLTDAVADTGVSAPDAIPQGPPFFHYSPDDTLTELLGMAGFERVAVEHIQFVHRFPSPDALWTGLIGGTVRMAALVTGQPSEVRSRLRASFDQRVARYANEDGVDIPVSVKIVSGRKAGTDVRGERR